MPYTPPPQPPAIIQQAQQIQDGVDAARQALQIREEVSRAIGHVAVQGTSQPY
jgi:hypothetical protein